GHCSLQPRHSGTNSSAVKPREEKEGCSACATRRKGQPLRMGDPRTSLWSRLVVFYSVNKRDQLNAKVMAEIVAKYGSKEKELSARLLKKYGRPLPPSVASQDLRRVLLEFGMEDEDLARGKPSDPDRRSSPLSPTGTMSTAAAGAGSAGTGVAGREPAARDNEKLGRGEGAGSSPTGDELNFRSKFFEPLQALLHKTLRPPFPKEPALDNLAKFYRMLPKPHTSTGPTASAGGATATEAGATAAVVGGAADSRNGVDHFGASPRGGGAGVIPPPDAAGSPRGSHQARETWPASGGGRGRYGPLVRSAADMERADKDMASRRRLAEGALAGDAEADPADSAEERFNPVKRIVQEYAGSGPYSLLYRLHEENRRASVMIRRVNSIRGTCTGLVRAFDRHMNLLLVDVRENYTAFVPARGPRPPPKLPSPKPAEEEDPIDRDVAAASKVTGFEGLGGGGSGDGGYAGAGGVAGSRDARGPEGLGKVTGGAGGAGAADDEKFVGISPADGLEPRAATAWSVTGTGGFKGGRIRGEGAGDGGGSSERIDPRDRRMPAVAAAAAASGAATEEACSDETREGGARTATRTKLLPQEWGVTPEREEKDPTRRTPDAEEQRPRPPLPPAGRQGGDVNRGQGEGRGGGATGEIPAAEAR
ncbi:unnamed protein product, partial [Ectocarpus sp. 8 AP-2014]